MPRRKFSKRFVITTVKFNKLRSSEKSFVFYADIWHGGEYSSRRFFVERLYCELGLIASFWLKHVKPSTRKLRLYRSGASEVHNKNKTYYLFKA